MPILGVKWDGFQIAKSRQDGCSRLCTPSWQPWIAVRCVANQDEVVWNGAWFDSELLYNSLFIMLDTPAPIELNNSCSLNALSKIFIRRTDDHALNSAVFSREKSCRRQCVICLILLHRPHHNPECVECLFQERELG